MKPMKNGCYLGIDIGGTNIRLGIVDDKGKILCRKRFPTLKEQGKDKVIARLLKAIADVNKNSKYPIRGIGIGCPGPLDSRKGIVLSPPNLPGWNKVPLKNIVQKRFKLPVILENDANCFALGEKWRGAAKGCKDIVCLTLGTGIGGAIILNGVLYTGKDGFGGELGHMSINFDGPKCGCGKRGCLEAYASATALVKRYKGKRDVTSKEIYESALQGDGRAKKVLKETAFYLGVAISNFVNAFNPEIVVLGGGLAKAGDLIFPEIRRIVRKISLGPLLHNLKIAPAKLGEDAGIIGAAWAVKNL